MAHSTLEEIPEQIFTESTIRRMFSFINSGKTDADLQKFIYGLVNSAMPGKWKDYKQEITEIFNWYKKHIDYRRDPYGVEMLQDALATIDRGRGDCDDATIFLATAAEILGSPSRIVTVSTRPDKEPNHVYAEALIGGRWLGLDGTIKHSTVGWVPPQVTARRIWTRKELGLGGDDFSEIEGLGMSGFNENGYGNEDSVGTMTPISDRLAPGVPSDISETRATGLPGPAIISQRLMHTYPVANNSEWTSMPRPGGGVYNPSLPVKGQALPQDLWYLVDRKFVPKVLDPDSAWWGKVPTSKKDLDSMFPGSEGTMDNYLKDIASVPASAIAEVENDVRRQLSSGEIGLGDLGAAIDEGLRRYARGIPQRMKLPPGQRGQRPGGKGSQRKNTGPMPMGPDRQYLVPGPRKMLSRKGGHLNGLGDLGDAITDAAAAISGGVQSGAVQPSAINALINDAVSVITGQASTPPPAKPATNIAATAIPVGMIALLGGAAWLMTRGGGKRKIRSNPSRRRSGGRRSGRGGGGMSTKTLLMLGGAGAAAYFLLLRPGATLLPAPKPAAKNPLIPGMTATEAAAVAAGMKAAPSIFDSFAKLFSSGPSAPDAAPGASSSGFVTDYSQLQSPPVAPIQSPDSTIVTSYG